MEELNIEEKIDMELKLIGSFGLLSAKKALLKAFNQYVIKARIEELNKVLDSGAMEDVPWLPVLKRIAELKKGIDDGNV